MRWFMPLLKNWAKQVYRKLIKGENAKKPRTEQQQSEGGAVARPSPNLPCGDQGGQRPGSAQVGSTWLLQHVCSTSESHF